MEKRRDEWKYGAGDVTEELCAWLAESDDEDSGEMSPEVPIKEEMVEKVMQELWKEITTGTSNPSFPAFSSPSSAVVGGDSERCGPTFSGSGSTVMAGVEMVGDQSIGWFGTVGPAEVSIGSGGEVGLAGNGPWTVEKGEVCMEEDGGGREKKMDGYDGGEVDDEWLARVLSLGPEVLEEWS